ncbi:MAG: thiamine ABC transporter substrate-binding protein [Anaerolineae bacterium]|nr:thiamine ABC transporter substrate-binding protein [Anaerolineae bacterium]
MSKKLSLLCLSLALFLTACAAPDDHANTLRVMTHDSFAVSDEVLAQFEEQYNVTVEFLASGDTGAALNKAVLSKGSPLADVFYGVDNTFLSRALAEGIFEPYQSPVLEDVPAEFQLDPTNHALPVDYGDVCVNYDIGHFESLDLGAPESLEDLADPQYKDMLVVENPASSSPGLAFLLATIAHFGEDGYLDFWQSLVDNGVLVTNDWETAYYTEFSYWGGTRPLVVSYGSSVAFEFFFVEPPIPDNPTGAVLGPQACFRQIEFVGILAGTENRDLAEKWVDFMLSPAFQGDLPYQMVVYPVNRQVALEQDYLDHAAIPAEPASLPPDDIAANRETWIEAWRQVVLQ